MDIYYSTYMTEMFAAEKIQRLQRERMLMDYVNPINDVVHFVSATSAKVKLFIENVITEFNNWADSQRACVPGSPVLADC